MLSVSVIFRGSHPSASSLCSADTLCGSPSFRSFLWFKLPRSVTFIDPHLLWFSPSFGVQITSVLWLLLTPHDKSCFFHLAMDTLALS